MKRKKFLKGALLLFAFCFTINAYSQLNFTVTSSSGNYSITCTNTVINLSASSNYTGSPVSYTWTQIQMPGIVSNSFGVIGPGIYSVSASAGTLTSTQTLTIYINTIAPSVSITANTSSITCINHTLQLQGHTNAASPTYFWIDGVPTPTQPYNLNTLTAAVAGTYTLLVKDHSNGCSSSNTINIGDGRIPPVISIPGPYSIACSGGTVNLSVTLTDPNNLSFLWQSVVGAVTSGANTPTLNTNTPGTYSLLVTNTLSGCKTWALIEVVMCVGITKYQENAESINIYPNPMQNELHFNSTSLEKVDLNIYNALAQKIYSNTNFNLGDKLELNFLQSGVYFLQIQHNNYKEIFKFIKE